MVSNGDRDHDKAHQNYKDQQQAFLDNYVENGKEKKYGLDIVIDGKVQFKHVNFEHSSDPKMIKVFS